MLSYIALHVVQSTLGMLLLGGLGHAPRKFLKIYPLYIESGSTFD